MRFLPHTEDEIRSMLSTIGVTSIDALFEPIPANVRLTRPLAIEKGTDEASLMRHLEELAGKSDAQGMLSFLGAGIYAHHVPPAVDQLLLRGEFMTAYTPYQAEVAQGTLQAIFEFQTIVSELFGLPIANASLYDGASATAEAVLMARRVSKRTRALLSTALHPEYASVVTTYLRGLDEHLDRDEAPRTSLGTIRKRDRPLSTIDRVTLTSDGRTDLARLEAMLSHGEYACVVVGQPNVLGVVEDVRAIAELAHKYGALLVTATAETFALSIVEAGTQCHAKAEYLKQQIAALPGFSLPYAGPTFNEFVVRRHAGEVGPMLASLQAKSILAGVDLGKLSDIGVEGGGSGLRDKFVVAVTERHTRGDLDQLVTALALV
ncbi:MAG: aminotransferase class V-fold PLP-dependent enzyme [Polyangiales bacterium]